MNINKNFIYTYKYEYVNKDNESLKDTIIGIQIFFDKIKF